MTFPSVTLGTHGSATCVSNIEMLQILYMLMPQSSQDDKRVQLTLSQTTTAAAIHATLIVNEICALFNLQPC